MEFTKTLIDWNRIRTRGIQSLQTYNPPSVNDADRTEYNSKVTATYFYLTQKPDGTEQQKVQLSDRRFFASDSRILRIWWVDTYYWIVKTDTLSALFHETDCVVTFQTTVIGNTQLDTKFAVEPMSASIYTVKDTRPINMNGEMKTTCERRFSISYHPFNVPVDDTNDTITYKIPIPPAEIERIKKYQAAKRELCMVTEGKIKSLPDQSGSNIQDYLTPKSRPYFEYVNKLLKQMLIAGNIRDRDNKSAAVFGGYVLNLIEHAFAYRADPLQTTYTPPKDIDVWLRYDSCQGSTEFNLTQMQRIFKQNIIPFLEESGHITSWDTLKPHQLNYSVHNLVVDGEYRFDFSGNTFGSASFSNIVDFTVNSLFYDVHTGKIGMRLTTEYTLRDIISDHIRNRKLVPMLRCDKIRSIIRNTDDFRWYCDKLKAREHNTQAKSYKYPTGLPDILTEFVDGMVKQRLFADPPHDG